MKIKLNNKNIGNIIRFFFSLVPLLFAIWLLINTGSSELIKNTESSANVPIASTISNGDEDEFIATDEFEEFTPYSSENTLKSDSSSETKDKYDNACN
jgi:hypothetical protein